MQPKIKEELRTLVNFDKLPEHIAIIMDGNGRWAKQHGKPRVFGHRNGVKAVREASEAATELGVKYLTLYAFSTENWSRPATEVGALMQLLVSTLHKEIKTLHKNNIRLNAIGDLSKLPPKTHKVLLDGIEATKNNTKMTLTLALNYSARWEIVEATKKIAQQVKEGILDKNQINDDIFAQSLSTAGIPDPELLIRTSGEHRISNYLLWQIAYAELCFLNKFWPDFNRDDFCQAIIDFQNRERRFGKISEQIQP